MSSGGLFLLACGFICARLSITFFYLYFKDSSNGSLYKASYEPACNKIHRQVSTGTIYNDQP
jgi:hypothetical protein